MTIHKIIVDTPSASYPIIIGANYATDVSQFIKGNQVLIVSQFEIYSLYGEALLKATKQNISQVDTCILPTGETHKTIEILQTIFDVLLSNKHNRTTTIIALGGGVVGDIAGFAAACYQRGVSYIQIPTTLLAQVDSSVGGKTAVNHTKGKNMIGAFYQPKAVIIDINTIKTLPNRDFSAGLAEVVKYGLIANIDFLNWLLRKETLQNLLDYNQDTLANAIKISCQTKADIVTQDEKETGARALLNFGHTFGHAIESYTKYKTYVHGEAVSIGMVMALQFSCFLGHITQNELDTVKELLVALRLPIAPPAQMSAVDFLNFMQLDKKNHNNQIRLILIKNLGDAFIESSLSHDTITAYLNRIIT